jgi:hypothetical protein
VKEGPGSTSQPEGKHVGKLRRDAEEPAVEAPGQQQVSQHLAAAASGSPEIQAARLIDGRLLTAQRFALAKSIGRVLGNRHLQSVIRVAAREAGAFEPAQELDESPERPSIVTRSPQSTPAGPHLTHSGHASIQRQAPPDADTSKVDALIAQVGSECDAFSKYKQSPLDGENIPGQAARRAGARWNETVEPWMPGYATHKMGPLRLRLLNEMVAMSGVGWPTVMDQLFGITYQKPSHKYTMELKAAKTITEKAIEKIVPTVTVSYANAFGWAWNRDYTLAAVEINAGISAAKAQGKKVKPKGGLGGGALSLDIKGKASADPTPTRYCGGNDFSGVVTVVKTSAKAHLGPAGGALPGLTAVVFHGTPNGEVGFPFITGLTGSISGTKSDAGVDVSIGAGLGKAIGRGETNVTPPPELMEEERLSKSFREWGVVVGPFNTGEAFVTAVAAGYLDQLRKTVYDFKAQQLDPIAKDLQEQSVDPDTNFQLEFEVVGMTSRSWITASTSAARLKLNEELSRRRATSVETEINNRFSNVRSVKKTGTGAHAVGPTPPDGGVATMLSDEEAQKVYEQKKKEAEQEKDPAARKMLLQSVEANYGPQSDQQAARRVYVFCRWEGFMIMKTLVPVNSSTSP